jgi:hypothetical protein
MPIYFISPTFVHINCAENGDGYRSSEEHLKNPLSSFAKIFEFSLVDPSSPKV